MTNLNQTASVPRRFAAMIIDGVILSIPIYILLFLAPNQIALIYAFYFIAYIFYNGYFESSESQATIGKKLMKIKVVDTNGERISMSKGIIRAVGKIISSLIFGIGFLMALFTNNKQSLHDKIASTFVVNSSEKANLNTDLQ